MLFASLTIDNEILSEKEIVAFQKPSSVTEEFIADESPDNESGQSHFPDRILLCYRRSITFAETADVVR